MQATHPGRVISAAVLPRSMAVSTASLRWREIETSSDSAQEARTSGFAGFGSCSFSEPRDDLSALGLL